MKLTPFGEAVRVLRMRQNLTMKSMADFMRISSSHLSGIEFGDKRLAQKHIDSALAFFRDSGVGAGELDLLRDAADKSKDVMHTSDLAPDARGLVALFARRLQEGDQLPPSVESWLKSKEPGKRRRK